MAEPFGRFHGELIGVPGGIEPGELACLTQRKLFTLAKNEGLTLIASAGSRRGFGCIHAKYCPEEPSVSINKLLPWPQFRWFLALAIGYHFTRHHHYGGAPHGEWRAHATQWATGFLSSLTASCLSVYDERDFPDNSATEEMIRRNGPAYPDAPHTQEAEPGAPARQHQKLDRKVARHRNRCHGQAKDGPCLCPAARGSAFCYHHQDQAANINVMSDLVAELAGTLEPGGST